MYVYIYRYMDPWARQGVAGTCRAKTTSQASTEQKKRDELEREEQKKKEEAVSRV